MAESFSITSFKRIYAHNSHYDELDSRYFYESEFENQILQNHQDIFPDGTLLKFKKDIVSHLGNVRADMLFIPKDLSYWVIIEVELSHHSLTGHVIPQIEKLVNGVYDSEFTDLILASGDIPHPREDIDSLVKGEPPLIYVISNDYSERWMTEVKRTGATFFSIRLFKNKTTGELAYYYDIIPDLTESSDVISVVEKDLLLKSHLKIHSPAKLPIRNKEQVDISFENKISRWVRFDVKDGVWLKPKGSYPTLIGNQFELYMKEETLTLRPK